MNGRYVNMEALRALGMLLDGSNGQLSIILAARAAMDIGDIVHISTECREGITGEIKRK